ncbi:hypothetical protein GCM10009555_072610 [Acrocarpospora macrocephala]|uniref:Uncharacterized protein n=1 Tax=Acrocarpospora macrocephala TaxID=150177 RepID=A0A5M3WKP5_9ACTN|nr:hypothetical protein [Acrocarpospora macrocephala]GES08592.1 hypothetical protein Amac_021880 [Acrocarpospora macrocephala]
MAQLELNCTLSLPESWGRHLRVIVITIIIVVGAVLGVDASMLPV